MIYYIGLIAVLCFFPCVTYSAGFNEDYISLRNSKAVKGVCILLILASHFSGYVGEYTTLPDLLYWNIHLFLGQAVVAMFLFYSGFGILESVKKKGDAYLHGFFQKRIAPVWITWSISQMIFAAANLLCGFAAPDKPFVKKFLLSLLVIRNQGNDNWYICVILILYLFAYISLRIFKERHFWVGVLVTVFSCGLILLLKEVFQVQRWWYNSVICFPMGLLYSLVHQKIEYILHKFPVYVIAFSVNCAVMLYFHRLWDSRFLYYIITMAAFTVFFLLLSMKMDLKNKFLIYCGTHLNAIFLMHRLPMRLLMVTPIRENVYLYFICSIAITLLLVYPFEALCNYFIKLFNSVLSKRKVPL